MTVATTYEDRIALIKKIAERKKKLASVKTKSKKTMATATKKKSRSFLDAPKEDSSKNPFYYTDASKYANQYYGGVYHETTKFDNDWD